MSILMEALTISQPKSIENPLTKGNALMLLESAQTYINQVLQKEWNEELTKSAHLGNSYT